MYNAKKHCRVFLKIQIMEDDRKTPAVIIDVTEAEAPAPTKRSPLLPGREPFELETEMNHYLMRFREAIGQGVFGSRSEAIQQSFNERGLHLIRAGKAFDDLTVNGIGQDQLVLGTDIDPVVQALNKDTRLIPNGRDFSDVVTGYYKELEASVDRVVSRIRTQGINYMMEGVYGPNEEASEDIEAMLRKLTEAKTKVSDEELIARSVQYWKVDEARREREKRLSEEGVLPEEREIARTGRHHISARLMGLVDMIHERVPAQKTANALIRVTNDMMHHLGGNLGERGLKVMGTKGKRPLLRMEGGPLHQLETMVSLVNVIVRDHEECVTLHRDLVSGNRVAPPMAWRANEKGGRT